MLTIKYQYIIMIISIKGRNKRVDISKGISKNERK